MKLRTKCLLVLFLALVLVLVGTQRPSWSGPSEPKFLGVEKAAGVSEAEAREIFGPPDSEELSSCGTPSEPDIGTTWIYNYEDEEMQAELMVCVYKGFVISHKKKIVTVADTGIVSISEQEYVAAALLKMLILMEHQDSDPLESDEHKVAI